MYMYQGVQIDIEKSKILNWYGEPVVVKDRGLGPQYVIYTFLKLMELRKVLPADKVVINEFIENEAKLDGSFFFIEGEEYLALELIQLAIVSQKTSVIFALVKLIKEKTRKKISTYFDEYNKATPSPCLENVSGKKKSSVKQYYIIDDLIVLGKKIVELRTEYTQMLGLTEMVFKSRHILSSNFSIKNGQLNYALSWDTPYNVIGVNVAEGEKKLNIVLNAPNVYLRDYLVDCLISNEKPLTKTEYLQTKKIDLKINKKNFNINIIGDTYPGEFYSDRRKKANRWDPLLEEGYEYSFIPLKNYLEKATLNFANFEAALVKDRSDSRLWQMKKFVLGGDPEPTIEALKKANITNLLLANNHLADYGESGIKSTKAALKKHNITFTGIGKNMKEALQPVRIKTKNREIVIFNAYWYRQGNYRYFDFYPGVSRSGVNCIDGWILEQIRWEKEENPENLVIVSPHWGVDFNMVSKVQERLAVKLVHAGADLIIGHGPHTLQKIDMIGNTPVIYSIGNGIFNSDGEFDGYPQSVPYGMIAELKANNDTIKVCLRPIYANNRETNWQPDFVDKNGFEDVVHFLERENSDLSKASLKRNYIEIEL